MFGGRSYARRRSEIDEHAKPLSRKRQCELSEPINLTIGGQAQVQSVRVDKHSGKGPVPFPGIQSLSVGLERNVKVGEAANSKIPVGSGAVVPCGDRPSPALRTGLARFPRIRLALYLSCAMVSIREFSRVEQVMTVEAENQRFSVPGCHQLLPVGLSIWDRFEFPHMVDLKRTNGCLAIFTLLRVQSSDEFRSRERYNVALAHGMSAHSSHEASKCTRLLQNDCRSWVFRRYPWELHTLSDMRETNMDLIEGPVASHQGGSSMSSSHGTHLGGRSWYRRVVLGLFLVVVLAGALFGPTGMSGVAHAASSTIPPNGSSSQPVAFQGGWIQTNPIVYLDFWGSKWNTDSNHIAVKTQVENTFKALAGGSYNNILRQYNNANDTNPDDTVHNDVRFGGSAVDAINTIPSAMDIGVEALGGNVLIGFGQIRDEANYALTTLFSAAVTSDVQVIVFPQQGTSYLFPPPSACGMHSYNSSSFSQPYTYSYIVYADNASGCNGVPDNTGNKDTITAIARSTAWNAVHEYAESATDPNIYIPLQFIAGLLTLPLGQALLTAPIHGSGWTTNQSSGYTPDEIADLCENYVPTRNPTDGHFYVGTGGSNFYYDTSGNTVPWPTYNTKGISGQALSFYLPLLWSNAHGCVASSGEEFTSPDTTFPFTGKHTVQGAILGKYTAGGGANWPATLGAPLTEEVPIAGGAVTYFAGQVYGGGYPLPSSVTSEAGGSGKTSGSGIYYHSGDSTHEVHGYIFAEYNGPAGGPANMGFPVTDEMATPDGAGRVNYFSGQMCGTASNHLYSSGSAIYYYDHMANYVWGCIYDRYQTTCGTANTPCYNVLGEPVASEISLSNGGQVSYFSGQICNSGWQVGNTFAGSGIYHNAGVGTYEVDGCIFTKYTSMAGPFSYLGYPTSDHTLLNGGSVSDFQGTGCFSQGSFGQIYNSPAGTYAVYGCIDWAYLQLGGYSSLGFPTSDQFTNSCGEPESDFQNAKLVWNGTDVVQLALSASC
jgi:hypothetical protein